MSNAGRHDEQLKLDAVEQVLAVPITDPERTSKRPLRAYL